MFKLLAWIMSGGLFFCTSAIAQSLACLTKITANALPHHSHTYAIILIFDRLTAVNTFTLHRPNRLVMDFTQALFNKKNNHLNWQLTPVMQFKTGIQRGINLRLVFTLANGVTTSYTTIKTAKNFQVIVMLTTPNKIESLEIKPVILSAPLKPMPVTRITPKISVALEKEINKDSITNNKISALVNDRIANLTKIALPSISPVNKPLVVLIDAGHGGKDPGTMGKDDIKEKDITLAIAHDLAQLITQAGMQAVLTRKGDYYVALRERLTIARKAQGDIFVAIHADAYSNTQAGGAAVFALSSHGASSESALWLAKQENYSELGGLDLNQVSRQDNQLRSILINLSQTATTTASLQLGNDVLRQLQQITDLHYTAVQQAPFMVLKSPAIPSILIETGFLSNPQEEARLNTDDYQQQLAQAIFEGIKIYDVRYASQNRRLMQMRGVS